MALTIENLSKKGFVIGINNKGELGIGDTNTRKSFTKIDDL
jgi:peptide subunit release factor RF-3